MTHVYELCHSYVSIYVSIRMLASRTGGTWLIQHINASYDTCKWVASHIWMSHTCHTYQWAMCVTVFKIWMSHVPHVKGSCHTYEWVTRMNTSSHNHGHVVAHIWMRHVLRMNASSHTHKYEWVTSHHVLRNDMCPACECVMSHMMMIAFIPINRTLVPMMNGQCSSNPFGFEFSVLDLWGAMYIYRLVGMVWLRWVGSLKL